MNSKISLFKRGYVISLERRLLFNKKKYRFKKKKS